MAFGSIARGIATGALRSINRRFDEERQKQYEFDKTQHALLTGVWATMYSEWPKMQADAEEKIAKYNAIAATFGDKVANYAMFSGIDDPTKLAHFKPEHMGEVPDFKGQMQTRLTKHRDFLKAQMQPMLGDKYDASKFDMIFELPEWQKKVEGFQVQQLTPAPAGAGGLAYEVPGGAADQKVANLQSAYKSIDAAISGVLSPGPIQETSTGLIVMTGASQALNMIKSKLVDLTSEMYNNTVEEQTALAAQQGKAFHQASVPTGNATRTVLEGFEALQRLDQEQRTDPETGGWNAEQFWQRAAKLSTVQLWCMSRFAYSQMYGSNEPFDGADGDSCYLETQPILAAMHPALAAMSFEEFSNVFKNLEQLDESAVDIQSGLAAEALLSNIPTRGDHSRSGRKILDWIERQLNG